MSQNSFGLSGVSSQLEFGKNGLKINGVKASGYFEVLLADGVTKAAFRVGDGVNVSDAVNLGQLNLKLDANKVVTDIDATAGYIADAPTVKAAIAAQISALIGSAPAAYDTLQEIAAWLEDHQDLYEALLSTIGTVSTKVDNLVTLSGMPANSADLGENTNGVTVRDNATVKEAINDLEHAIEHEVARCKHVVINHNTASPFDIGSFLPAGATYMGSEVQVTTAWNGASPTLNLGKAGATSAFMDDSLIDLKSAGHNQKPYLTILDADTTVIGTINHDGSTQGGAIVAIHYC